MVCRATTAFWQAYLKGNAATRAQLADGGLRRIMRGMARVEAVGTPANLATHHATSIQSATPDPVAP
jgi:hypothetical protein